MGDGRVALVDLGDELLLEERCIVPITEKLLVASVVSEIVRIAVVDENREDRLGYVPRRSDRRASSANPRARCTTDRR
jgi:hypothetical protein